MTGACFRRSAAAQVMEATLNTQDKLAVAPEGAFNTEEFMKTLPGISEPMGYFDPLGTPTSWNPPFITGERDIIS